MHWGAQRGSRGMVSPLWNSSGEAGPIFGHWGRIGPATHRSKSSRTSLGRKLAAIGMLSPVSMQGLGFRTNIIEFPTKSMPLATDSSAERLRLA